MRIKSFSEVANEGYLWNGEQLRGTSLRIDLGIFETLSRDVGYLNAKANQKDENDDYDLEIQEEYEKYRGIQLDMFNKMLILYDNPGDQRQK